jgi:hypothetical protein
MRTIPSIALWLLIGCGGPARPSHEPTARAQPAVDDGVERQGAVSTPGAPTASAPVATTRATEATCLDAGDEETLRCDAAPAPARPLDQVLADLDARAAAQSSSARRGPGAEDEHAPRDLDAGERSLTAELAAHRCARAAGDPERPAITYRMARILYAANHFGPAAPMFDDVARDPRAGKLASYASMLALDSLDMLSRRRSETARRDCISTLAAWLARYIALLCGAGARDEQLCEHLHALDAAVRASPPPHP